MRNNFLLRDGQVLFIKADYTMDFEMSHLANITTRQHFINIVKRYINFICYFRFILVTHNSDYPVPRHRADRRLLKHPLLIRWFAQNIAPEYRAHKKMEAIPIGLPNQCIGYQLTLLEPYLE